MSKDNTSSYTDEELIELGRSALKESKIPKSPGAASKAWDMMKEPFGIVLLIIVGLLLMLLSVFACLWSGTAISDLIGTGVAGSIGFSLLFMLMGVGVWWFGIAVVTIKLEEKGIQL